MASVFCSIAAHELYLSLTNEKTSKGRLMSEFVVGGGGEGEGEGEDRIMLVARRCFSEVNSQAINRTAKDLEKV